MKKVVVVYTSEDIFGNAMWLNSEVEFFDSFELARDYLLDKRFELSVPYPKGKCIAKFEKNWKGKKKIACVIEYKNK